MRNSILARLLAALSLILILSAGVSLFFADKSVRKIVEKQQLELLKEKIGTLVKLLEARSNKLAMTTVPDAYREDFQQAALEMIKASYYTKENLSLQSFPLIINSQNETILQPAIENSEILHRAEILLSESLRYTSGKEYTIIENRELIGVFLPFKPWSWQVGYVVPADVMYNASNRLRSILFWTMFVGTFAAFSVISFTMYRLVKPLSDLRKAADALASGDYSRPFNNVFNKQDEVGSLARSLEKMRIIIEERIAELKGANEMLQKEIQAREEADAARLRQELDYQEIFNATSEAIIIFDAAEKSILRVNNTMLEMFGYTLQQVVGQEIDLILREKEAQFIDKLSQSIEKAVAGERVVFEWRIRKQDGACLWTEISLRSAIIGGSRCVLAVFRDVSKRKVMELEKIRMEEQLRQVQKMEAVGTLAEGVAHDFNNILTPLLGYSEMLVAQLEEGSEPHREAKAIHTAGIRARDLVKQILTISRKEGVTVQPVLVQKEVVEAASLVEASLPKNITMKYDIDESCDPVLADPGQIHQVIMNLLTNGAHAMKDSGGILSVSLNTMDVAEYRFVGNFSLTPGAYVKIQVIDTGAGIPDDIKKKIFDPYYTTKVAGEGTGLGLSIVQNIMKGINGHIMVASEPGKTVFSVYLPCVDQNRETSTILTMDGLQKGDESILLVDDERSVLDVSQAILEKLGYTVSVCNGSTKGLEAFRAAPDSYELIITDMTMPDMSGFELSRALKSIRPEIPIIMITGYSDILNKNEAQQIGISAILTKPIDVGMLSLTVRRALANSRGK